MRRLEIYIEDKPIGRAPPKILLKYRTKKYEKIYTLTMQKNGIKINKVRE